MSLLFLVILSFMVKLPYGQLVVQGDAAYGKNVYGKRAWGKNM